MNLSNEYKRQLKSQAHSLKPVIMVGNKGLTENVIAETDRALDTHELIKIKIASDDRDERKEIAEKICADTQAELIQSIGRTVIIFRKNTKD